jgi:hypothetical protein
MNMKMNFGICFSYTLTISPVMLKYPVRWGVSLGEAVFCFETWRNKKYLRSEGNQPRLVRGAPREGSYG